MHLFFTNAMQLRMLFSGKDKKALVQEMSKEVRKGNKGKGKAAKE